jgi:hypothetical protein
MMPTDEQVIHATRTRLADELSDLGERADVLAAVRRRYSRRRTARLAAGAAAVVAAAAVALPLAVSGSDPGLQAAQGGPVIRLAGNLFILPANFHVSHSSQVQVDADSSTDTLHFALQSPASAPPAGARHVTIGHVKNYWYLQTPTNERLYVYFRDKNGPLSIVITATGLSRQQLFAVVQDHGIQVATSGKP